MKKYRLSFNISGEIKLFNDHDIESYLTQGDWYRTTYEIRDKLKDEMIATVRRNKFSLSYQHLIFDHYQNYLATLKFTRFYKTNHITIRSSLGDLRATGHLTQGAFNLLNSNDEVLVSITKSDQGKNIRDIEFCMENQEELLVVITIVAFKMGLMMVSIN